LILGFGLPHAVGWYVTRGGSSTRVKTIALGVGLLTGIGAALATFLLGISTSSSYSQISIPVAGLFAAILGFSYVLIGALLGGQRYTQVALLTTSSAAATAILVAATATLTGSSSATLGAVCVATLVVYTFGFLRFGSFEESDSPPSLKRIFRFGRLSWVGNILQQLNFRLDILLLGAWSSASEVGIYAAAVTAAQLLWIIPNAAGQVSFGEGGRLAVAGDHFGIDKTVLRRSLQIAALVCVPSIPMFIWGPGLIRLVLGSDFGAAGLLLRLILPGVVAYAIVQVCFNAMSGAGRPGLATIVMGGGAIVTVVGDILYIPTEGATAAAIVSSAAYATSALLAVIFLGRGSLEKGEATASVNLL
jgi:O-antigen/teichoic acid export membrane protein